MGTIVQAWLASTKPAASIRCIGNVNTRRFDLNLLVAFEALLETRSVSQASERLGISQPSMSHALSRMRDAFGDPLFVRVKNEMVPTPRALEIAAPVARMLALAREEVFQAGAFEPAQAEREFVLCMTDVGAAAYLPAIMQAFCVEAPRAHCRVVSPIAALQTGGLDAGNIDLAIGYFPDVSHAGMYQQGLLRNAGFQCVARAGNPYIVEGRLSLHAFMEAPHVAIRTEGRSQEVVEAAMARLGVTRRVVLALPHYLSLFSLIAASDMLAVIPHDLATALTRQEGVCAHPLPFASPTVPIHQIWHKRFHRDEANRWLRDLVHRALQAPARSQLAAG